MKTAPRKRVRSDWLVTSPRIPLLTIQHECSHISLLFTNYSRRVYLMETQTRLQQHKPRVLISYESMPTCVNSPHALA